MEDRRWEWGRPVRALFYPPSSILVFAPRTATIAAMDDALRKNLRPGVRVSVTQQIAARDYAWASDVRGTVVGFEQKQTGSWFAHSKNDKLWLDRLTLEASL